MNRTLNILFLISIICSISYCTQQNCAWKFTAFNINTATPSCGWVFGKFTPPAVPSCGWVYGKFTPPAVPSCVWVFKPFTGGKFTIRGYIKDGNTGQLISDSTIASAKLVVIFQDAKGTQIQASMVTGSIYSVMLPAGTYTRIVTMNGYNSLSDSVVVSADSSESVVSNTLFLQVSSFVLRGYIKDGTSGQLIPDATLKPISVAFSGPTGSFLATLVTGSIYSVTLPAGTYTRTVTLSGYTTFVTSVTIQSGSNENNAANTITLTKSTITIRGYVKDGTTGLLIPDATLQAKNIQILFAGSSNFAATLVGGSIYEVSFPPGNYKRTVTMTGYSGSNDALSYQASDSESDAINTIYMVQAVTGGWRVVLTWGPEVKDMDSYCITPDGTRINYKKKTTTDGTVVLDLDNRTGFGPETLTLKGIQTGLYKYYVDDYTKEVPIMKSEAKVTLYQGSNQVAVFQVPTGDSAWMDWHVFDIDAAKNTFTTVNQVTNGII